MSIIRVQKNSNYSVISNVHINDERLSWKATAILTYLLSKPNDWTVYVKQLAGAKKDGIKAVYSGVKELKEYGYIEHRFIHGEDGKIQHGEYIVHEEPMIVETPVNPESEPYTQKGDTVKRDAVNGTLLNTEVKINTDDDKQPAPESANPGPQEQDPPKPSPSSLSGSQLIAVIASLMALIPERHQKRVVERTIGNGLKTHVEDYVRLAVLYSIANSNGGTVQKFKAFLGKCIDNHWHDGWEPDTDETSRLDLEAVKAKFKQIPDTTLKQLADVGNQLAIEELKRRKE